MSGVVNFLSKQFVHISATKRFWISVTLSTPVLFYQPVRSLLSDKLNGARPDKHLKALISEAAKEQNLDLKHFNLVLKDQLNFELYPSLLGKHTLVIPKYLTAETLDDLKRGYLNGLLKREYGLELKNDSDWYSEEGKQIISSFLLTDNAKKFLLARYMHHLNNYATFTYFYLAVITLHVTGQLAKWHRDLAEVFSSEAALKRRNQQLKNPGFWRFLLTRYRWSTMYVVLGTWIWLCTALCYGAGVKQSRDSDAMTLSRSLADATTIKSRTNLIDFNYYSGGEEAYGKVVNRNHSLNRLFFNGLKDYERIFRRIPFDAKGNELRPFSNQLTTLDKYENLNKWEITSGAA